MENNDKKQQMAEEKEKAALEFENKLLAILLPSVGLIAFIIGLVGSILVISTNIGIGVFLIVLALLGCGGMAYGVMVFLKWRYAKTHKKEHEPSKEPDNNK